MYITNKAAHLASSFFVDGFGVLRTSISICFSKSPACPMSASTCVNCVRFFPDKQGTAPSMDSTEVEHLERNLVVTGNENSEQRRTTTGESRVTTYFVLIEIEVRELETWWTERAPK